MATPDEQQEIFGDAVSEIEELLQQIKHIAVNKLFANPATMESFRTASTLFLQDLRQPRH